MPEPLLLDTCAALWLVNGDPLSARSRNAITATQRAHAGVYVSPITAWEIATLIAKGRIELSDGVERWFDRLLSLPGIRLAELSPEILIASALALPGKPPRDPADRILAATARALGLTLITRDGELLPYATAGHLTAIAC